MISSMHHVRCPIRGPGLGLAFLERTSLPIKYPVTESSCTAMMSSIHVRCSPSLWLGLAFLGNTPSLIRNRVLFPRNVFSCPAKFAESELEGSFSFRTVPPNLVAAEKEEAKAVLTLFLKKQGLSNAGSARIIKKSEAFIDHLVSRLHSIHKSHYLVGRELTTLEIRDALIPYLETLHEEYGDILVDVVESYPNLPVKVEEKEEEDIHKPPLPTTPSSPPSTILDSKKLKALARVTDPGPKSKLPSYVPYLAELGMDIELIRKITRKFPAFAFYSLEGKIKPVVEFLLELGIPKSQVVTILTKRPQLCGISLSENLIPTMTFLENLGVDKTQWAKVIYRSPSLLTYSKPRLKVTVDFLYEMGLSAESVSKVLTRCPNIISYSVEDKLRPAAEYFRSLGVDVATLLYRCPQTFGLSINTHIKPTTEFFVGKGYSVAEVASMVSKYAALYTFSLATLVLKWDFFLTMGYPKSELIKFPQYFGYSLEERIKPRYAIMIDNGVRLLLNQLLSLSDDDFDKALKKKLKKLDEN
nr:transcription termination factor MTERF5, chloroplastic [Ipomoea batatas]